MELKPPNRRIIPDWGHQHLKMGKQAKQRGKKIKEASDKAFDKVGWGDVHIDSTIIVKTPGGAKGKVRAMSSWISGAGSHPDNHPWGFCIKDFKTNEYRWIYIDHPELRTRISEAFFVTPDQCKIFVN